MGFCLLLFLMFAASFKIYTKSSIFAASGRVLDVILPNLCSINHSSEVVVIGGNVGGLRDNATPAMVCTANDLHDFEDFPKGLRVLLLEQDSNSAAQLKAKLEAMDYIVSTFCNENDALTAVADKCENFHVAIVEVSSSDNNGTFKFLENARDLPTIMISNIHCLNTMMKCIALGAVEFLHKPLCEDKLRNIWQHVVHKVFNAGGGLVSDSLKPVKESLVSMLNLQLQNDENEHETSMETKNEQLTCRDEGGISDKYPAPSTPQLEQGIRLVDDGDCHDQTNCSTDKEQDGETKSVETTFDICSTGDVIVREGENGGAGEAVVKEEDDSAENSGLREKKDGSHGFNKPCKASNGKVNRKKVKVDWTTELHKKFVHAVEQLGVDQAIPSRILEIMKVEGLTRHNVASHLQKYRMHRRHILPKEDDRRWHHHQRGDSVPRSNYYPHRPIMAFPPYHSNHTVSPGFAYPIWGAQGNHQAAAMQMWGPPAYPPPWQASDNWQWRPYTGVHADAWGCPVMQPAHSASFAFPQNPYGYHYPTGAVHNFSPPNSFDLHPAEEVIDKVVKEVINKPWLPLPLGLKPPSAEGVLAELSRQGVPCIPPHHYASDPL